MSRRTKEDYASLLEDASVELREVRARLESLEAQRTSKEPIAIIGLSCRFPGADAPASFWALMCEQQDAIKEVPRKRWDIDRLFDPNPDSLGKVTGRCGGFLNGLEDFDADFFGISPREAPHIDPRQRLVLELGWEALEDAGIPPDSLAGSCTGVYISTLTNDYDQLLTSDLRRMHAFTGAGIANSVVANRLSYVLDLRGPSMTIDTACSGSLLTAHLACQSLRLGESDLALAGGVSVNLSPKGDIVFSRAGALSPEGRCRTFDDQANGIVRSEGAALVVLKPLSAAQADGDRIYAVIYGSATNHDGFSNGIMAPNKEAQKNLLRIAYQQAGVAPSEVQYVETHGTGTALGDQIEVEALADVLSVGRGAKPCVLGSVKTNIGHMEAAAGVGGMIKTALAIKNRRIPPNLYLNELNHHISSLDFPLKIPQSVEDWPIDSAPLIAGVSSFSFGGTNAHLVLGEPPSRDRPRGDDSLVPQVLPLSARSPGALRDLAEKYRQIVGDSSSDDEIRDICYTAGVKRSHHDHRLAVVFGSRDELDEQLKNFSPDAKPTLETHFVGQAQGEKPKITFVFSGQMSYWHGMARTLYADEPVFRESIDICDDLLRQFADWSLSAQLHADEGDCRLGETDLVQPAIFSVQVGLAALWRSLGVGPDAIVGQSLGEVAAVHLAGCLSLEDSMRVVCHCGRLMREITGQGKTAVVGLAWDQVQEMIGDATGSLSIAGNNSPESTLVAGTPEALEEFMRNLEEKNVFCQLLKGVDVALHSPQIDPLQERLVAELEGLQPMAASIPLFSTVTGGPVAGEDLGPEYWGKNLREPIRFVDVVECLLEDGHQIFVEMSPHPVLSSSVEQIGANSNRQVEVFPTMRRQKERPTLCTAIGALYALGCPINWQGLYPTGQRADIPTYPWQKERYWFDQILGSKSAVADWRDDLREVGRHPLLGSRVEVATSADWQVWETDLNANSFHYLSDHRVLQGVILPAAAYVEMALAAAREMVPDSRPVVEDLELEQAFVLPEELDTMRRLQFALKFTTDTVADFRVYSRIAGADDKVSQWVLHVEGKLRWEDPFSSQSSLLPDELRKRFMEEVQTETHYKKMKSRGLDYGPLFQTINRLWHDGREALGELQLAPALASEAQAYNIFPSLLDGGFQVLGATTMSKVENQVYLPKSFGRITVFGRSTAPLWCHASLSSNTNPGDAVLEADLSYFDESGKVVVAIKGFRLQLLDAGSGSPQESTEDLLYEVNWSRQDREVGDLVPAERQGRWVIFADEKGVGKALAAKLGKLGEISMIVRPGKSYKIGRRVSRIKPTSLGDYKRLFENLMGEDGPTCRGVVYLWGLNEGIDEETAPADLLATQVAQCNSVLYIVQALAASETNRLPQLWIATKRAQQVDGAHAEMPPMFTQTSLWGLGRVVAIEHPEVWGGAVDLDYGEPGAYADALCGHIWDPGGEQFIAYRGGDRYVARLARLDEANTTDFRQQVQYRQDGCYLITGGLMGLGLETARFMINQGARRLIVLGRSALPDRSTWDSIKEDDPAAGRVEAVKELEAMGASIHSVSVDVADADQMNSFWTQFKRECWPSVRGVVHAAGLTHDKRMVEMGEEEFHDVLAPKVHGAWLLHQLTKNEPLDFFVVYSSIVSIIGRLGQANYAAANAFLDGLAHYLRTEGVPALSINWGPWDRVGMFARLGLTEHGEKTGVFPISPEQGLDAMALLLNRDVAQATAIKADWSKLRDIPLVDDLVVADTGGVEGGTQTKANKTIVKLLSTNSEERQSVLEEHLRDTIADMLQIQADQLDIWKPLVTMGMDSLLAFELKAHIDKDLRLSIGLADLFTDSVAKIAGSLVTQFEESEIFGRLLAKAENLSEEEVCKYLSDEESSSIDLLADRDTDSIMRQLIFADPEEREAIIAQLEGDEILDELLQRIEDL